MPKYSVENLSKYKEILINNLNSLHIFYFELSIEQPIKGHYALDNKDHIWLSEQALNCIFGSNIYLNFPSKFLDVTESKQMQFFQLILPTTWKGPEEIEMLFEILKSNKRNGAPRKHLMSEDNKRISIEFELQNQINFQL